MKWEYKVLHMGKNLIYPWDCEDELNELGKQGWELVNIYPYYGYAYFKRQIDART